MKQNEQVEQVEQCTEVVCSLLREHVSSGGDTFSGHVAIELYGRLKRELREWDPARDRDPYDVALRSLMVAAVRIYEGQVEPQPSEQ